eukprot:09444_3
MSTETGSSKFASTSLNICCTCAGSEVSHLTAMAFTPMPSISLATASAASLEPALTTTLAPLLPSSIAIAFPIPRLAPVTMARVMSGPCDLVARVEAALRSLGVTPVKEEPVKASADVAASTASAAYF